jgi:hypothetical protein
MGPGTPTDDNQPATGPNSQATSSADQWPNAFSVGPDQNAWLEANLLIERRYLELGRNQIDEMCLDLKARLAARMSQGLRERLAAGDDQTGTRLAPPEMTAAEMANPDMARRVEAAAAAAARLLDDISWVLPWEQAKELVEPYAKGSWLLAHVQAIEEQRVVSIFAAELTQQAAGYMRELIFRFYGADQLPSAERQRSTLQSELPAKED